MSRIRIKRTIAAVVVVASSAVALAPVAGAAEAGHRAPKAILYKAIL